LITIVNYGVGNVQAIANLYRRLHIDTVMATTPEAIATADRLILPGVGAFDGAMGLLQASGMREPLDEQVLRKGRQVLGICVGMQMLAQGSDEGNCAGLGWIDARVRRFPASTEGHHPAQLPHMGWNDVAYPPGEPLFRGLGDAPRFYFLHSYYFEPAHSSEEIGTTEYGLPFASAVRRGNIMGVQFHPEKSHHWGIALLKNFAEL
jgi:imidazole glycerol-phosphate synthase subunit HisH